MVKFLVGVLVGFLLAHGTLWAALKTVSQVRVEFPPGTQQKLEQLIPPLKTTKEVHEPTKIQLEKMGLL